MEWDTSGTVYCSSLGNIPWIWAFIAPSNQEHIYIYQTIDSFWVFDRTGEDRTYTLEGKDLLDCHSKLERKETEENQMCDSTWEIVSV